MKKKLTKDKPTLKAELEDFRHGIEVDEIRARYWEALRLEKVRRNKILKKIKHIWGK